MISDGPFDLGVEEEYQVVDPRTWELRSRIHPILEKDREDGVEDVRAEFLQSQVEANTRICATVQEVRMEVVRMREEAAAIAGELGLTVVAAGTHPFSCWTAQEVTQGDRYAVLAEELQDVGRRLVTFGLHIHVGIAAPDLRVQVMSRLRSYLPLFLALSTSSPFFSGRFTGLQSYRTALMAALPRTGVPPRFDSWAEYRAMLEMLLEAELLSDPSFVWWDIRPSARFPTVEVRIPDMPTEVEETVCLAAWVQALAAKLAREPKPPLLSSFIVEVNKWQAARYGLKARLLLSPEEPARTVPEWVRLLLDRLADIARELGSEAELAYALTILDRGSSADRQLQIWQKDDDFQAVMEHLMV